jgi:hypothetical protein
MALVAIFAAPIFSPAIFPLAARFATAAPLPAVLLATAYAPTAGAPLLAPVLLPEMELPIVDCRSLFMVFTLVRKDATRDRNRPVASSLARKLS